MATDNELTITPSGIILSPFFIVSAARRKSTSDLYTPYRGANRLIARIAFRLACACDSRPTTRGFREKNTASHCKSLALSKKTHCVFRWVCNHYITGGILKKRLRKPCKKTFGVPLPRVEATGFEPTTSASRTQRSTKLSHASIYISLSKNILYEIQVDVKNFFDISVFPGCSFRAAAEWQQRQYLFPGRQQDFFPQQHEREVRRYWSHRDQ